MNQSKTRITAFDFARALAIFGMIIVNYKIAMQAEHSGPKWLQSIAGLFEGRASALFVLLAGIGVALMTSKARSSMSRELIRQSRMGLYKRAAFLFIAGVLLLFMEWSADILHYYAVFMLVAAVLITVSDRLIIVLFLTILSLSQVFLLLFDYSKGWNSNFTVYTDFWTLEGFARNLLFNGFHPLFPWLCFFLIGLWIGRKGWITNKNRSKLLLNALLGTVIFESMSYILVKWTSPSLGSEAALYLFGTKPMPPTMLYVLSGISSALAIIAVSLYIVDKWEKFALTQAIIYTGQLSFTHYYGHVVIGLGLLQLIGYLENGSLAFAVAYGSLYFVMAIAFSYMWRKQISRGPIELLMRKLC
ncbi:DUF418 domain-containing protein [Paenibacillus agilis]|uniref:DUF1624 domain-containing protein n=1 Tax=Paenibacillus agilis TaxID=3020863 RepID=A0A559J0H6_9BACL|nr:heparan-alpha-glucosaminide N-acetyltransferase domain-containing protein [Paenibacillus agilis]TVX93395.1 DUF1624 domain-containing protein [Paenibacillus agilis]